MAAADARDKIKSKKWQRPEAFFATDAIFQPIVAVGEMGAEN
jgi:hypothetical protein